MVFNNKRLEKVSKLINYIIAIVLCGFLISLSGKLIDDVEEWKERPGVEEFQNIVFLKLKNLEIENIDAKINLKREEKSSIENTIKIVNSNYENAKKSFDNWLEARKTVDSSKEDKVILSRAMILTNITESNENGEKDYLT